MAVKVTQLVPPKLAEAAQTTQYTAPAGTRSIIDKFTARNASGDVETLSVNIVAPDGAAGAGNLIIERAIAAGETYTFPALVGHVILPGGAISTEASTDATLVVMVSGREVVG